MASIGLATKHLVFLGNVLFSVFLFNIMNIKLSYSSTLNMYNIYLEHLVNLLPTVHFHSHKRLYEYFLSSVSDIKEQDKMSTMICFTFKNIFFLLKKIYD